MDINAETPKELLFMKEAFKEAQKALLNNEVPIGAIVVHNNTIIGRGYNQIEKIQEAPAHAEIIAINEASKHLGTWRLEECTLYVTLEPCMMCLGASLQSRIDTIIYGASDNRFGAISNHNYKHGAVAAYKRWPLVIRGIMEDESRELIQSFFKKIRKKAKEKRKSAD
jgi:tRNA(adenine34) deaminase